MSLLWLVLDWRRRLAGLNAGRGRRGAGEGWLVAIRVRILSFLVARYAPMAERPDPPTVPTARTPTLTSFCRVDDPTGPPPRPNAVIRSILRDIRACNAARPRRRWLL